MTSLGTKSLTDAHGQHLPKITEGKTANLFTEAGRKHDAELLTTRDYRPPTPDIYFYSWRHKLAPLIFNNACSILTFSAHQETAESCALQLNGAHSYFFFCLYNHIWCTALQGPSIGAFCADCEGKPCY